MIECKAKGRGGLHLYKVRRYTVATPLLSHTEKIAFMIDKQTELWFSQPMIGTIGDVTILPMPPDQLDAFCQKWTSAISGDINTTGFLDFRIIEINGIPTPVKYDPGTRTITIP